MIDLQNEGVVPTLDEIGEYVRNPVFDRFCREMQTELKAKYSLSFSRCSWQPGWNVKFRGGGKNLCTVYPRESFFTVLVVIGQKEKGRAEAILPACSQRLREICETTRESNSQRWLMIDVEDADEVYRDTLELIRIRKTAK